MKIELGDKVKDKITGLDGIVTGITCWLNGCVRATVQPRLLHEGKPLEAQWFDVEQLEIMSKGEVSFKSPPKGGPMPDPSR